jgi:cytochrome c peroxidase
MRFRSIECIIAAFMVSCGGGVQGHYATEILAVSTDTASNAYGQGSTFDTNGPIDFSSNNLFFAQLGVNGRTCGTCHVESAGWTITPSFVRQVAASNPNDPLFAPVDGSDCPLTQNGDPAHNSTALMNNALIRITLPIPLNAEFRLNGFADPHRCAVPPSANGLYMYRRPLPSTNLPFLATVMWDGRENTQTTISADLNQQANDATLGHAQATQPLTSAQTQAIFAFENTLFTAQTVLTTSLGTINLTDGVNGGPAYLALTVAPAFTIGINDTFSPTFTNRAFTIYSAWEPTSAQFASLTSLQQSVGRGEALFNTRTFSITNVDGLNGLNDVSQAPITGTCTSCHDDPEAGNHSVSLALNIGTSDASSKSPAGQVLDISHLPIYTFVNNTTKKVITVTDPGRGLITGKWKDVGKVKGPTLRGVASHEPLFHNGSASITTLISFYNLRFSIGFSPQDRADLANFLKAL